MAEVTKTATFDCSVEDFYKVVADYAQYPEFLTEVKTCRVVKTQGNRKKVEFGVNIIKTFTYSLWMVESPYEEIRWEFGGGDMFKSNTGYWRFEEDAGKCRAVYHLDCTLRLFMPGPIEKTLVQVNLPSMISSYHKRVSQLYG